MVFGYTEHSHRHISIVSKRAGDILEKLGYPERTVELAKIAGYMHDIGNCVNRVDHAHSGAILSFNILKEMGMPVEERTEIMMAIGNHDENTGTAISDISAALILADKSDVHRQRVSNTNLSTLHKNENVQFTITFKTPNESYDLFKNPVLEIKLPNNIKNINVNSINKVYADEFEVEYARLQERGNEKYIQIALNGEQKDYAKEINEMMIVIDTNIEFDILTPSQKSQIIMKYSNENGNRDIYEISKDINIESKSGLMMYSSLSGYNSDNETIYTIDDSVPTGFLEAGGESKVAVENTVVVNNYDREINDVVIIGYIPKKGINEGTVDTTLVNIVNSNLNNAQILYSTNGTATVDDASWSTDSTNATAYMLRINSLLPGQIINLQYQFNIPQNIGYGQSIYAKTDITYRDVENLNVQSSKIGAKSENVITDNILALGNTSVINKEGLGIAISGISGGKELQEGESVYEGQIITYMMQITNNTGTDLHNLNVKAIQENGHLYDLIEEIGFDPNEGLESQKIYHRYDEVDTNEKQFDIIESLANGESVVLEYNIVVSERVEGTAKTKGTIFIKSDELEEKSIDTISNSISQGEIKLKMESPFYEEEVIYLGRSVHANLTIENISDSKLENLQGSIQLPRGIYLEEPGDLTWESTVVNGEDINNVSEKLRNLSYDKDNSVLTFEIANMEVNEITELTLYFKVLDFEEEKQELSFLYEIKGENTYVSNIASIDIINTKKDVIAEQTASTEEKLRDEDVFEIVTTVTNNENEDLYFSFSDVLPEGLTVKGGRVKYQGRNINIITLDELDESDEFKIYENIFSGGINMSAQSSLEIILNIEVDAEKILEKTLTNTMEVTYGIQSNSDVYDYEWSDTIQASKEYQIMLLSEEEQEPWVQVTQVGAPEDGTTLENGQDVLYTFNIKNMRNHDIIATLYDYIPKGIVVEEVKIDNTKLEAEDVYIEGYTIPAEDSSTLEISGYTDIENMSDTQLVNNLTVSTVGGDVTSNNITYKIAPYQGNEDPENPEEPENPDNPNIPVDPENPNEPGNSEEKHTISGIAWIDSNRDGKRDSTEPTLSGIGVSAINTEDNTYVDTKTSSNGRYEIELENGNYILIFSYDTNRYNLTEYRKEGVLEDRNSDVINRTVEINGNNSVVGATDVISIKSGNVENIDIGLTEASKFDLELNKYVSQIIVQTNKKTTQYGYNNQTLAKVEIPAKELNGAIVTIKYEIKVKNTGEVAGYVQNIVDYMPSDLEFDSKLNSNWNKSGVSLENTSLANTQIRPGEERVIELVLTKKMNDENTKTVVNIAEIQSASNVLRLDDIDSTPGNNKSSEDDLGRAEVIISIGTGTIIIIISAILGVFILIATSVVIIKKKVLRK